VLFLENKGENPHSEYSTEVSMENKKRPSLA
jgi:hypothetical protein